MLLLVTRAPLVPTVDISKSQLHSVGSETGTGKCKSRRKGHELGYLGYGALGKSRFSGDLHAERFRGEVVSDWCV